MCTQCEDDIVLDFKVLRVSKVVNLKELLYLVDTFLCQAYNLVLLIYHEVTGLFLLHTHDGIHLGVFRNILTTPHLIGKNITCLV